MEETLESNAKIRISFEWPFIGARTPIKPSSMSRLLIYGLVVMCL